MKCDLKHLVVILGPTASGKTELSLELAKKFNGQIVNADSRQIYKEMNIGTAKPAQIQESKEFGKQSKAVKGKNRKTEQGNDKMKSVTVNGIPHYLIDIIYPNEKFSLAQYKELAIETIRHIHKQNRTPFLVGGTGLYISAVVNNLNIPEVSPNTKLRSRLNKETGDCLFNKLKKVDPKSAFVIGPRNKRKLIRALEVYEITGRPFSTQQTKGKPLFNILQIGLKTGRNELYRKIDARVDKMVKNGLVEETRELIKKYNTDLPSMSAIAYKEISMFLEEKISLKEATKQIKFHTHQYARRQMTWFKGDKRIKWIERSAEAEKIVSEFLE